jgi:hypothetical protein
MLCKSIHNLLVEKHRDRIWKYAVLLLILAAAPLGGQTRLSSEQSSSLPATTGEPLTIVPVDLQDIECSIQEWNSGPPKPFLKLLCPPKAEFAPLRVYLKLSWLKSDDVPMDVRGINVVRGQPTKIRANESKVLVLLEMVGEKGRNSKAQWVGFNGVVDVAIIKDSHRPRN